MPIEATESIEVGPVVCAVVLDAFVAFSTISRQSVGPMVNSLL